METVPDRVRRARQVRGWSIRRAAAEGDISNETWGKFERARLPISDAVRRGVAKAFDWPGGWESFDVEPVLDPTTVGHRLTALEDPKR